MKTDALKLLMMFKGLSSMDKLSLDILIDGLDLEQMEKFAQWSKKLAESVNEVHERDLFDDEASGDSDINYTSNFFEALDSFETVKNKISKKNIAFAQNNIAKAISAKKYKEAIMIAVGIGSLS